MERESKGRLPGARVMRYWELLLNARGVLFFRDENSPGDLLHSNVNKTITIELHAKNGEDGKFYVTRVSPQF